MNKKINNKEYRKKKMIKEESISIAKSDIEGE